MVGFGASINIWRKYDAYDFLCVCVIVMQPKATFKFPSGEVSLEEKKDEEVKRVLSINGFVKGSFLNGVGSAFYSNETLNLRYSYKVRIYM